MKNLRAGASGFTLVEVMIVVAIIGLLASIAIPTWTKARDTSRKNSCVANLKLLDGAKNSWAMEFNKAETAVPNLSDLVGDSLYIREIPLCPGNGSYILGPVNEVPTCTLAPSDGHTLPYD